MANRIRPRGWLRASGTELPWPYPFHSIARPEQSVAGVGWVPALYTRLRYTGSLSSLSRFPRLSSASCALGDMVRASSLPYRSVVHLLGVTVRVGASMPSACSRVR